MPSFIDMHSHVAWGIDDGMPDRDDANASLRAAAQDGLVAICSTPHFVGGQLDDSLVEAIFARQKQLAALADSYGIKIYSGGEMFMNESFIRLLDEGWYQTLNNSCYLLCEFDVQRDIHTISAYNDYLYEIEVRGMIPVIAHVERYFHEGLDMDIIEDWKNKGYVFQINRTSLQGLHGSTIQNNAWTLLENGYAHLVCTDTHRASGHRVAILSDIHETVVERVGEAWATELFYNNPLRILLNRKVHDLNPDQKVEPQTSFFKKSRTWLRR